MRIFSLVLISLVVVGSLKAQSFQGKTWVLQSINDRLNNFRRDIDPRDSVKLVFLSDSNYVVTVCNSLTGSYKVMGSHGMTTSRLSTTYAYCDKKRGDIEKKLLTLLQLVNRFDLTADRLVIYTSNRHEMVFESRN